MKPPHSNRPGSGHAPSNRDSGRNFGGSPQRPQGGPARGQQPRGGSGEPGRGFGGVQQRSSGGPPHGQPPQGRTGDGGRNFDGAQQRSYGGPARGQQPQGRAGAQGQRDERSRYEGPRPNGPSSDRARSDGPRHDSPHHDGPRQNVPRPGPPRPEGQRGHGQSYQGRPQQDDRAGRNGSNRNQDRPQQTPADAPRGTVWLYGLHAVAAALANPARRLRRLVLTEDAEATLNAKLPPPWSLQPERVDRGRLDHLLGRDIAHQGIALLADPLAPPILQQVLERPGPIVVLDQVTDPRNVGAILRSAAAFAAAAVITQDRNAPEETGALAKAASGALETMPLLRAVNIARTLIALKAANCWTIGLDAGAKAALSGPSLVGRRVALVLGAEGEGLRRLTRETCDELAGLAMAGAMESLNVSAAGAVALYELTRRA
jgi:23S rRNA (guanosine2251-2'-O)-methyltransferase